MSVPGTLSAVAAPSNTTTTTTTTTVAHATESARVKSDVARPQVMTAPARGAQIASLVQTQPDQMFQLDGRQAPYPPSPGKLHRHGTEHKAKRQNRKQRQGGHQNTNQNEDSGGALNDAALVRLLPGVRNGSDYSNTGARQEAAAAVASRHWLLERNDAAQFHLEVNTRATGGGRLDDCSVSPCRHLHAQGVAEAEWMDDEAVIAIDVLREWGGKEKEELFLRHPRLEPYTTGEPLTPLSAVLTGLSLGTTPTSDRHARTTSLQAPPPNTPSHGRHQGNKAQALGCHAPANDPEPLLNHRGAVPRNEPLQVGHVTAGLPPQEGQHSLEARSVAKTGEVLEDDNVLSRGLRGQSNQTVEDIGKLWLRRRGERMNRRAVRMSGTVAECHLLGADDVLQVLRDETGGGGSDGAPLPATRSYDKLSRSAIRRVVALADRSLRRRAGDNDSKDLIDVGGDVRVSTVEGEEETPETPQALQLLAGIYQSAEDELCGVMDLWKMAAAAACAEALELSTPSTATEVVT
ncbi:uncharacterized protein Tco025E_04155 [Trypanosoma conorhini]|uniref:Uncharacterized protein n=1 Tax=Trypanosoma conorhini TaxID=83891 RepID=A0A422PNS5_9TRYP|nr:uncharacterized protein Tco025E_04155 [Trypanosoma conorhini]RNF19368.1 hypothetical protein Tco025E_04155 [Trypanosoma conorhini]